MDLLAAPRPAPARRYAGTMSAPFDQAGYQVRLDWGTEGLARMAPAHIVVVVDVLSFSSTVIDAVAAGTDVPLSSTLDWGENGAAVADAAAALDPTPIVLVGGIRNAAAIAQAVLTEQDRRGDRTFVTVIAAGEKTDAGDLRFAVEDQLGAGAIVSALTDVGIDHTSPEAVAAGESARALRRALRHLLSASGSGRELTSGTETTAAIEASGFTPTGTADAATLDATEVVPVFRDGVFTRWS